MENKLLKKLQVKPGFALRVVHPPAGLAALLGDLPAGVQLSESGPGTADAVLIFAADSAALQHGLKAALPALRPDTVTWVAYPKKSSGLQTDLNLMTYWRPEVLHGLEPCASISISDTWTGIRLRPLGQSKASGLCNNDIEQSEWAQYIDVRAKKIVALPDELRAALALNREAAAFFDSLSYSNRKEYLLWNLNAKQEKTKRQRLEKTIGMLASGKKNPGSK